MSTEKLENEDNLQTEDDIQTELDRLTHTQRRFLAEVPFTKSDAEAARRAGVTKFVVSRWKSLPAFRKAYEQAWAADAAALEARRERLSEGVAKAVEAMLALLDSRNPNIRLKTACEILDRAGVIRGERLEHAISAELQQLLDKAAIEEKEAVEEEG